MSICKIWYLTHKVDMKNICKFIKKRFYGKTTSQLLRIVPKNTYFITENYPAYKTLL